MSKSSLRIGLAAAVVVAVTGATGCSNLVVKKVPLDKRIEGRDDHVKGFRYYLNRPYLAVNDKVFLGEPAHARPGRETLAGQG